MQNIKTNTCPQCGKSELSLLRKNFFTSRKSFYCTNCNFKGELPLKTSTKIVCWTISVLTVYIIVEMTLGNVGSIGLLGIIAPVMLFLDWRKRNNIQKYWIENKLTPVVTSAEKYGIFKGIFFSFLIVLFSLLIGPYLYSDESKAGDSSSISTSTTSIEQLIISTVNGPKSSLNLPSKIDEVTTLVDVTAEKNAIRYHYTLSGLDTSQISELSLKSYLKSDLCKKTETLNLLKQNINFEYLYTSAENNSKYFVVVSYKDCQNN